MNDRIADLMIRIEDAIEQRDAAVARAEAAEQAVQRVRELLVEDAWHYDDEIARALDGTP